ncbi:helix-turn-helix domain-containing protein [Streptomyces monashensis]|uniref:helix-turn-helix domain-containing protein n=1 Tax=Streptomyces monashensis TaxID=1678012 RepID=UPI001FE3C018|nr:helix-turn-helix domain-containing protein [Streptomyces monashensis]
MLLAIRGRSNAWIAAEVGVHVDTVRTCRGRLAEGGLPALADRKRSGRPARFTPVQVAEAKAWPANSRPGPGCRPLARWSRPEPAAVLTAWESEDGSARKPPCCCSPEWAAASVTSRCGPVASRPEVRFLTARYPGRLDTRENPASTPARAGAGRP